MFKAGGLTQLQMSTLYAILLGREWDLDLDNEFKLEGGDGESDWIFRFPSNMTSLLANSPVSKLDDARIKWAATEEMGVDPKEIFDLMAGLHKLARHAIACQKSMYLWFSL